MVTSIVIVSRNESSTASTPSCSWPTACPLCTASHTGDFDCASKPGDSRNTKPIRPQQKMSMVISLPNHLTQHRDRKLLAFQCDGGKERDGPGRYLGSGGHSDREHGDSALV